MNTSLDATEPQHAAARAGLLTPELMHWLESLGWRAERIGAPSAWWTHVPFAHWLVSATTPGCLVELGTHAGVSYAAFCEATITAATGTRCYAVDTWKGDSQAGEYGEEVFEEFSRFHDDRYTGFSTLLRCTFDKALDKIADHSVDILHIDGLHTYEAVRHDFESWRPKLSSRGVVLFHDTNEYGGDFGVWRFWAEAREQCPSFEFLHGHGLGVLAVGDQAPDAVLALCAIGDRVALAAVRGLFARLGERWWFETRELRTGAALGRVGEKHVAHTQAMQGRITQAEQHAAMLESARVQFEQERQQVEHATQAREVELREEFETASASAAKREVELRQALAASQATALTMTELEQQRSEETAVLRAEIVALRKTAAEATRRAIAAEQQEAVARAESAEVAATLQRIEAQRVQVTQAHDIVLSSTLWRATWPLRTGGRYLPLGVRRALRGTAKLGRWTTTLALPAKRHQRNDVLAQHPVLEAELLDHAPVVMSEYLPLTGEAAPATIAATAAVVRGLAVWISGESGTPGHCYRVARPMASAASPKLDTIWMRLDEVQARLHEFDGADVVIFWRTAWDEIVALAMDAARRNGAKVVFDVDDLMVDPAFARLDIIDGIRTQDVTEAAVGAHYERIRLTMMSADFCIATTEELAGHMRRWHKPTIVIPNGFDGSTWRSSRLAARLRAAQPKDELVRLGYASGSRTHQRDFAQCADAVAALLSSRPECRLVLFRSQDRRYPCLDVEEFPALQAVQEQIEWRTLVPLERLPDELARFDVNLAPLEVGNPYCESKSELKVFEAALVGVPTVASPTGPFSRALRHGETGFLAGSSAEWLQALMRLVDDAGLRQRLGRAAGLDALWAFGPERRAQDMALMLGIVQADPASAVAFEIYAARSQRPRRPLPGMSKHEVLFATDTLAIADVTVVIPLYNYAETVIEALDSARLQTIERLDLVVVDDCSTDNSLQVVLDWVALHSGRFSRVVVARNGTNQGLGVTRNTGFGLADTPWIMALDADNRLRPGCVQACLNTADRDSVAFVYPIIQHFGESTHLLNIQTWDPTRLIGGNFVDAMALVSRAAWVAVGGYDTTRTGWEDFDLWCCFVELGLRGAQVPGEPFAEYRVHDASMIQDAMRNRDKVRWMMDRLMQRHPWLHLVDPTGSPAAIATPVTPAESTVAALKTERLDTLLPLLRCPITGGSLMHQPNDEALISADGTQVWPMVAGRPVFFRSLGKPRIVADDHLSNSLPESALALIEQTRGQVLHLSAGGSAKRYDHVIEAEAAIFRHTDIVADVHDLPFADEVFEAVIALNAFEHYRDPQQAAREILRVLKPGGRVLIRTAFMQPQHEAPWHFYNCTRYGLAAWFEAFETQTLWVSENFNPGYSLSWLASECEAAVRKYKSAAAANLFMQAPMSRIVSFWRASEATRGAGDPVWQNLATLPQEAQEGIAAGFEYMGRKPTPQLGPFPAVVTSAVTLN